MYVFLLTTSVPVEVSGISLNITNHIVYKQIIYFFTSTLVSLLRDSNFDLCLLQLDVLDLARAPFLLRNFLLISGVIQGTEEIDELVFDGLCFSSHLLQSLMHGGMRPQLFLPYSLIIHSSMNLFSQHSRQFILSFFQVFEA